MSPFLIAVCGLIYLGVAIAEARRGNWPMVVVYWHYAGANVGLVWLAHLQAK